MSEPSVAVELTPLEALISRPKRWLARLRRKLPYLVWFNDELDVSVTFREARLPEMSFRLEDGFPTAALAYLSSGRMAEIERALGDIGITFDKGGGACGRDWEWDWSLTGPISVRFRDRAKKPERRQ